MTLSIDFTPGAAPEIALHTYHAPAPEIRSELVSPKCIFAEIEFPGVAKFTFFVDDLAKADAIMIGFQRAFELIKPPAYEPLKPAEIVPLAGGGNNSWKEGFVPGANMQSGLPDRIVRPDDEPHGVLAELDDTTQEWR